MNVLIDCNVFSIAFDVDSLPHSFCSIALPRFQRRSTMGPRADSVSWTSLPNNYYMMSIIWKRRKRCTEKEIALIKEYFNLTVESTSPSLTQCQQFLEEAWLNIELKNIYRIRLLSSFNKSLHVQWNLNCRYSQMQRAVPTWYETCLEFFSLLKF